MPRYLRKLPRIGHALGPSEERGFALWVGYEIADPLPDPSRLGLIPADHFSDEELREHNVAGFKRVRLEDLERWTK